MDELAKKQAYQLERDKEAKLEKGITNCKIVAPLTGVIVYPNDPARLQGGIGQSIEEGATVHERQLIFRVYDLGAPLQVDMKVPEAMVDQVKPGQQARIEVHAFSGQTFTGVVTEVSPLPNPISMFLQESKKLYTTKIKIEKNDINLRPGMSATAEIPITEHDNVLTVPVKAVLRRDGKDQVAVRKADGTFEWRDVTVGNGSETLLEITQGLKPGEQVAIDAGALLSEAERQRIIAPTKPAAPQRRTGKTKRGTSG